MKSLEIYTKNWCGYCTRAKRLLDAKGVDYTEYDVTSDLELEQEMLERSGRFTVPQIFIDGVGIGGSDELARLEALGRLDKLLEETGANDDDEEPGRG